MTSVTQHMFIEKASHTPLSGVAIALVYGWERTDNQPHASGPEEEEVF